MQQPSLFKPPPVALLAAPRGCRRGGDFARELVADPGTSRVGLTLDNPSFGDVLLRMRVRGLPVALCCWRLSEGIVRAVGAALAGGAASVTVWCDPVTEQRDLRWLAPLRQLAPRVAVRLVETHAKGVAAGGSLVLASSNGDGRTEWNWWAHLPIPDAVGWFERGLTSALPVGELREGAQAAPARTTGSQDLLEGVVPPGRPLWLAGWNQPKGFTRRLNARGAPVTILLDDAVDRVNPEAQAFRESSFRGRQQVMAGVHAKLATDGEGVCVLTSANWQVKNLRSEQYVLLRSSEVAGRLRRFVEEGRA